MLKSDYSGGSPLSVAAWYKVRMAVHIHASAIQRRKLWVAKIRESRGEFGDAVAALEAELNGEIASLGSSALRDHLRLCGAIPEGYGHDSSEEKFYSKYTDILLSAAFESLGIRSHVLTERADAADVQCHAKDLNFVADAKAFRLSRTAKNQKDFKVQAMHGWKRGNKYAMVACPLYQMPARTSQIYLQAISNDVCLFSYSHLCVLTSFAEEASLEAARDLLHRIFQVVVTLHPSKDASVYWQAVNKAMLDFHKAIAHLWQNEKAASSEALSHAREEGLVFLSEERDRIMKMSHKEAVRALVTAHKIENREKQIRKVADNGLMEVQ